MTPEDRAAPVTDPPPAGVARLASISIDCPDPATLADFYEALLGMPRAFATEDGRLVSLSDGRIWLTLMRTEDHVAPTWPGAGQQQQMHLDLAVTDLEVAVTRALALGAALAEFQPKPDAWRVLLDPAGHPFCLTTVTAV